eukprot:9499425-Pyramimonas_sp.AAC.1
MATHLQPPSHDPKLTTRRWRWQIQGDFVGGGAKPNRVFLDLVLDPSRPHLGAQTSIHGRPAPGR